MFREERFLHRNQAIFRNIVFECMDVKLDKKGVESPDDYTLLCGKLSIVNEIISYIIQIGW